MKLQLSARSALFSIPYFLITYSLIPYSLSAAVPLAWTVETSRATPATFEAYQGETLEFAAALQSYGKPLAAPSSYSFFWQTNGMGNVYWEAKLEKEVGVGERETPLSLSNSSLQLETPPDNILRATWRPEMDVGARVYNCFIGSPTNIYRAAFQLRMRPSPGALPNILPLPQPVIDFAQVKVLNPPWEGIRSVDGAARPLPKYLHLFEFDSTYPDDADWYCDRIDGIGYCSSVRRGDEYARNYDWTYDESITAVVKVPASEGRFASVGVASVGTNLTEEIVTGGKWSRFYKCLPGMMLDGINENGVVANINVVAKNGSEWETKGERTLNILRSVRWILDTATTASNAAEYVAANAYVPPSIRKLGYSIHLMVADKDETWIVEDGVASNVTSRAAQVMTNFRVLADDDPYGSGYERYDILADAGSSITNAWYANAYKPDADGLYPWPTEFAAPGIGTHTQTNVLQQWARENVTPNLPPKRNGKWWQTVHTSVYDLANRTLRVAVQEVDDWYTFAVPVTGGGVSPEAVRRIVRPMISADNPDFSSAVLAVAVNTNSVEQIGELKQFFDKLPPGTVGTSLGGIVLALLGAVAWLKKRINRLSEFKSDVPTIGDIAKTLGWTGEDKN